MARLLKLLYQSATLVLVISCSSHAKLISPCLTNPEGDYKDLRDIIYIMSKASLHVGADSGMMHIAKFLMPINKIHVYINIRERKDDSRFPDSRNVPFMAREIFRRGAKMNFCEYPHDEQIKYFKDVSLWA